MLVIRAVKTDDLDALIEMARQAGSGMTTLKPDRKMLGDRVATAVASFNESIPPEKREDVFKPFVRLDEARNQDEGGSGLGLAIARDIARSHGGDVVLGDSPLGGLRATVRLPT